MVYVFVASGKDPFVKAILAVILGTLSLGAVLTPTFAADLPIQGQVVAPPIVVPNFNWSGFYLGAQAGWAQTSTNYDAGAAAAGATTVVTLPTIDKTGGLGGLYAGYNYQAGQLVFGVEADANAMITGDSRYTAATGDFITAHTNWVGSVRGRLGYAFDRTLVYATGGLALADPKSTVTGTGYSYGAGDSTRFGWTLGAGAEYALTDHWITGLEYRYTQFQSDTYTYPVGSRSLGIVGFKQDVSVNQVTARISYKF